MKLITGMHRSGTSLVARLFYEAGADMGDPQTFYLPDRWNPDGYYEQPDIHAVNMPLINGPWGKLAYFKLPSSATIARRAARMADRIRRTAAAYQGKVVKETRFSLTLEAWRAHGLEVDAVVICLREPYSVARSLQRRNHIPMRLAYHLWRVHNERLLDFTRDLPRRIVAYHRILDPSTFAAEMKPALAICGLRPSDEQLESLREKCVKPSMNHASATGVDYPEPVQSLWNLLLDQHARQTADTNVAFGARGPS
jgi:hypothetical protein